MHYFAQYQVSLNEKAIPLCTLYDWFRGDFQNLTTIYRTGPLNVSKLLFGAPFYRGGPRDPIP